MWRVVPKELKELTDVSDTLAPTSGQLLGYNGTEWNAIAPPDTFPEAPTDGQNYLRNGKTTSWVALGDDPLVQTYGNLINQHTTDINTINSAQTTQNNRLGAIEAE